VSYILDALTKAAQQRDRQAPVVQRLLSPVPRARSPWSHVSGRLLAALAVNAVLLSVVLVWWLYSASTPAPSEPTAAPAPSPASPRPRVKLEPMPTTDATVEKPSRTAAAKPSSATREPRADAAPPQTKPSAPLPASPRASTPTVQPTPTPTPSATPPGAAARPAAPQDSAGLRVEALIYADAPAERMVFINGRRYREGDTIDGRLRIEEIREDGVELSDQGRRFTLRATR
jgi:general secretion pathway protein B